MKQSIKSLWRGFYECERDLFSYFTPEACAQNGIQILMQEDGCTPSYHDIISPDTGKTTSSPPKQIRTIAYVPDALSRDIKKITHNMRDLYIQAVEETTGEFKRLPRRFPKFFTGVNEIRISTYPAHASTKIIAGKNPMLSKATNSEYALLKPAQVDVMFNDIINQFQSLGIGSYLKDNQLMINGDDLLRYAGATRIQMRKQTGHSYECRIFTEGESKATRCAYGFLLLDTKPVTMHVQQHKLPERRIENKAQLIEFDFIPENIKFWKVLAE